ncbi:3485_t:CDS:2, partial [Acaulospora morrowiae]
YDFELQVGNERHANVPILVVGTKADLVKQELTGRQRRYSIVDEYGGDCVNLCTLAPTHFAPNSIASEKIDAFFDKVIDKKFGFAEHLTSPSYGNLGTSSSALTNRDDRRRVINNVGVSNSIMTNGLPPSPGLSGFTGYANSNAGGNAHPRISGAAKDISPAKKQHWNGFRQPMNEEINGSSRPPPPPNNNHHSLRESRSSSATNLRESYNAKDRLNDNRMESKMDFVN